jgi:WD40 repeat protein
MKTGHRAHGYVAFFLVGIMGCGGNPDSNTANSTSNTVRPKPPDGPPIQVAALPSSTPTASPSASPSATSTPTVSTTTSAPAGPTPTPTLKPVVQAPPPGSTPPPDEKPAVAIPVNAAAGAKLDITRLSVLPKHDLAVVAATLSPDGTQAATVGLEGKLKISDGQFGFLRHEISLEPWPAEVPEIRTKFAPDGKLLAVTVGGDVRVVDAAAGEVKLRLKRDGEVRCVRFTAAGDRLVTSDWETVVAWSIPDGGLRAKFPTPSGGRSFALTSDGASLVCGGPDGTVAYYDLLLGQPQSSFKAGKYGIVGVALNADESRMAAIDGEHKLHLIDARKKTVLVTSESYFEGPPVFTPDGLLAAGAQGHAGIFFIAGDRLDEIEDPAFQGLSRTDDLSFSPDGRRLLASVSRRDIDDDLRPQDRQLQADYFFLDRSQEELTLASSERDDLQALAVSTDGRWAAWSGRGLLSLYSIVQGKVTATAPLDPNKSGHDLQFSPDSTRLAFRYFENSYLTFRLFAVPSLEPKEKLPSAEGTYNGCFVPGSPEMLLTARNEIRRWNFAAGTVSEGFLQEYADQLQFLPGAADRIFINLETRFAIYSWPDAKQLVRWDLGHEAHDFAVSPDGALVATYAADDKRVFVWDAASGKLVKELPPGPETVWSAAFSSDSQWLLTGDGDGKLRVWSRNDWSLRAVCPADDSTVHRIFFVPKSTRFFTNSHLLASSIKQWDLKSLLERVPPPTPAPPEVESPVAYGQPVQQFDDSGMSCGGYIAGGRSLFAYYSGTVRLFDATSRAELWALEVDYPAWCEMSADGQRLAAAFNHDSTPTDPAPKATVIIWNADDRRLLHTLRLDSPRVRQIAISPDGRLLAAAGGAENKDSPAEISLWDVESGTRRNKLPLGVGLATKVQFSPDGTLLAFVESEKDYGLWDMASQQFVRQAKFDHPILDLQFSPDGKSLALCGGDHNGGAITIESTSDGTRQSLFADLKDKTLAVAFTPQADRFAALINDKTGCAWRFFGLPDGREIRRLDVGYVYTACSLRYSPDGRQFVTAGDGFQIWDWEHLLDLPLQREIRRLADRKIKAVYEGDLLNFEFPYDDVTDRELEKFPIIGRPFGIRISSEALTDEGVAHLASQKHLTALNLQGCTKLTQSVFSRLKGLPLKTLQAQTFRLSDDAAVAALGDMTTLETLRLSLPPSWERRDENFKIDLQPLSKLKNLRNLAFLSFEISSDSLRHLAGLTQLRDLYFESSQFKDDDLRHLAGLTRLHNLTIRGDDVFTGAGLKHLAECRDLETLDLTRCSKVNDDGIEPIRRFSRLRVLKLRDTAVRDRGLTAVAGLTELVDFELPLELTDAGMAHLSNLTKLRSLFLHQPQVTDQGLLHLAKLTALEEFSLSFETDRVTGSGLAALAGAAKVQTLYLGDLKGITDDGLKAVGTLKQLRTLHLPPQITVAGLKHLTPLENLTDLELQNARLTDADLAIFAAFPNLDSIDLEGCPLTDAAIPHLAALKNISAIRLGKTKLSADGVKKLEKSFPEGRFVYIEGP